MSYYFFRTVKGTMEKIEARVRESLKTRGFGVLTEIDVREALRSKLGVEFRPYRILGACNPSFAFQALLAEDKIGTMLPCNVILQEKAPGEVEVAAVDPLASMRAVENPGLAEVADQVGALLKAVVDDLE